MFGTFQSCLGSERLNEEVCTCDGVRKMVVNENLSCEILLLDPGEVLVIFRVRYGESYSLVVVVIQSRD